MAYLNFTALQGDPVATPADLLSTSRAETEFSDLQWQVVAIAEHDRVSSLRAPSFLGTALSVVFGSQRANPRLADPALEALRRTAVLAWRRGGSLPEKEIRAFHDAGYTADQYEALLASISRRRAALKRA